MMEGRYPWGEQPLQWGLRRELEEGEQPSPRYCNTSSTRFNGALGHEGGRSCAAHVRCFSQRGCTFRRAYSVFRCGCGDRQARVEPTKRPGSLQEATDDGRSRQENATPPLAGARFRPGGGWQGPARAPCVRSSSCSSSRSSRARACLMPTRRSSAPNRTKKPAASSFLLRGPRCRPAVRHRPTDRVAESRAMATRHPNAKVERAEHIDASTQAAMPLLNASPIQRTRRTLEVPEV